MNAKVRCNFSKNNALSKNGIPKPKENNNNINAPFNTLPVLAASISAVPKNAPTHGVQHNANIVPKIIDDNIPKFLFVFLIPFVLSNI